MTKSIGSRISELRREKGITQEKMSERLGITSQAVSKWENDISYPDILQLPKIAQMLGVTVDELISGETKKDTRLLSKEQRKHIDDMMFRINVNSSDGDKVRINLPMALVKMGMEMGMKMPQVSGNKALTDIDFQQLIYMVESGLIGKIVEVESSDGDTVEILVE